MSTLLQRWSGVMMNNYGTPPLALASGAGAELRMPLGVSIIGGLLLSQVLTLYTTPVIYLAMERLKARFSPPVPLQTELELPESAEPSQQRAAE